MNITPAAPMGQTLVPVQQIEMILESLTTLAGQLEELACDLATKAKADINNAPPADIEKRIAAELQASLSKGTEAYPASALADYISEILAADGIQLSVTQVRRLLPPIMLRLFGAKLSCSVKDKDGRVVRGYRGLALRDVQEVTPAQQ